MGDVIPLIWFQDRREAVLLCVSCNDVAIYTYPEDYKVGRLPCGNCGKKHLTTKIPRNRLF